MKVTIMKILRGFQACGSSNGIINTSHCTTEAFKQIFEAYPIDASSSHMVMNVSHLVLRHSLPGGGHGLLLP